MVDDEEWEEGVDFLFFKENESDDDDEKEKEERKFICLGDVEVRKRCDLSESSLSSSSSLSSLVLNHSIIQN
jgi:hypothetical protein